MSLRLIRRQLVTGLLVTVVLIVILGIAYPVVVWAVSQAAFNHKANGSLVTRNGKTVGSSLIGQQFTGHDGNPLPQYFQPRPSAAGSGYDASSSGASNLGPSSNKLLSQCLPVQQTDQQGNPVTDAAGKPVYEKNPDGSLKCDPGTVPQLAAAYRQFNGLPANTQVPVDAVTSSGSGLDPDISVANALLQAPRVAKARNLPVDQVVALVHEHTRTRPWGVLGEDTVNVLDLNLALDKLG